MTSANPLISALTRGAVVKIGAPEQTQSGPGLREEPMIGDSCGLEFDGRSDWGTLAEMSEANPDVFGERPFDVSCIKTGHLEARKAARFLDGLHPTILGVGGLLEGEHCSKAERSSPCRNQLSYDLVYQGIEAALRARHQLNGKERGELQKWQTDMAEAAFAVRAYFPGSKKQPLGAGLAIIRNAVHGARMYRGLARGLEKKDLTALSNGARGMMEYLLTKGVTRGHWQRFEHNEPVGFTGDVEAIFVEPGPAKKVILSDFGTSSFADLIERQGGLSSLKSSLTDMLTQQSSGGMMNRIRSRMRAESEGPQDLRVDVTDSAGTYVFRRIDPDSFGQWITLRDRPAYFIGLGGWTMLEGIDDNPVRLEDGEAAFATHAVDNSSQSNLVHVYSENPDSSVLILRPGVSSDLSGQIR